MLPIILVVAFFQTLVFRQPIDNLGQLTIGLVLVIVGLALFVSGLELGLFPIGEGMAHEFAKKGSVPWLILFAFALGFGTTFAEPALIAISEKAAMLRWSNATTEADQASIRGFAMALRVTVAIAVGLALVIGVLRIIKGWPLHVIVIAGYALVVFLTLFAPRDIVAIAYDSGGITTSTITVPLTAALGIGLANSIRGRNPMLDGFGLIALASLLPILMVLIFGMALGPGSMQPSSDSMAVAMDSAEPAHEPPQESVASQLRSSLVSTVSDILPITLVIAFFQGMVLRRPIANLSQRLWGWGFVIVGLAFFLVGLPLVAALGLGLASNLPDRHPVIDGFGMIALAVLMPMITVMGYAQFAAWQNRRSSSQT